MKLQLMNGVQESEPVARVRVEMVDHELIKLYINEFNVINIWGTYNKKAPSIYVFKDVVEELGFHLEVV